MRVKSMHMVVSTRKPNVYLHFPFMPRNTDPLWDLFRKISHFHFVWNCRTEAGNKLCIIYNLSSIQYNGFYPYSICASHVFVALHTPHSDAKPLVAETLCLILVGCLYFQPFSGTLRALSERLGALETSDHDVQRDSLCIGAANNELRLTNVNSLVLSWRGIDENLLLQLFQTIPTSPNKQLWHVAASADLVLAAACSLSASIICMYKTGVCRSLYFMTLTEWQEDFPGLCSLVRQINVVDLPSCTHTHTHTRTLAVWR